MGKPIIADMSYIDKEGREIITNSEQIVRFEGNSCEGLICIDFDPGIKPGDGIVLRIEPFVLMQAITDALIEHKK